MNSYPHRAFVFRIRNWQFGAPLSEAFLLPTSCDCSTADGTFAATLLNTGKTPLNISISLEDDFYPSSKCVSCLLLVTVLLILNRTFFCWHFELFLVDLFLV